MKQGSLSESGELESEYPPATVMALRFAVLSTSLATPFGFRPSPLGPRKTCLCSVEPEGATGQHVAGSVSGQGFSFEMRCTEHCACCAEAESVTAVPPCPRTIAEGLRSQIATHLYRGLVRTSSVSMRSRVLYLMLHFLLGGALLVPGVPGAVTSGRETPVYPIKARIVQV